MSDFQQRPSIASGLASMRRRWPALESSSEEQPIFILSAGWRSGSTWLQRMLMPSCFVWGEPYGHAALIDSLAEPIRCFRDDWPEPHFIYQGQTADVLKQQFIANLYPPPETLLSAHLAFFDALFVRPARDAGSSRWGLKEVRLTIDHAQFLRWLFPKSKIVYLVRNPYDAYRSLAARRNRGWYWFHRWPNSLLTTAEFGRHWREAVTGFLAHRSVSRACWYATKICSTETMIV